VTGENLKVCSLGAEERTSHRKPIALFQSSHQLRLLLKYNYNEENIRKEKERNSSSTAKADFKKSKIEDLLEVIFIPLKPYSLMTM
jgi:hypothetical protein